MATTFAKTLDRQPCWHCGTMMSFITSIYDAEMRCDKASYLHGNDGSVQQGRVPCAMRRHFVVLTFEFVDGYPKNVNQEPAFLFVEEEHAKMVRGALRRNAARIWRETA